MLTGGTNLLEIRDLLAFSGKFGVFQQDFAVAKNGIQRSAKFVAHLGQEIRLGAIRAFRLFLRIGQFPQRFCVASRFLSVARTASSTIRA